MWNSGTIHDNLYTFGKNDQGQLGLGFVSEYQHSNFKVKQVSAGTNSSFIDFDNNIWICGSNWRIKPYSFMKIQNIKAKYISTGNMYTLSIDPDNNVFAFGDNLYGKLGLGDTINRRTPTPVKIKALKFFTGYECSTLIDINNNLWVCGRNHDGQLGLGDRFDRYLFTQIPNIKAKDISFKYKETRIINSEGNIETS